MILLFYDSFFNISWNKVCVWQGKLFEIFRYFASWSIILPCYIFYVPFHEKSFQIKHTVGLRLSQKDAVMLLLLYNFKFDLASATLIKHIIILSKIADKEEKVFEIYCWEQFNSEASSKPENVWLFEYLFKK